MRAFPIGIIPATFQEPAEPAVAEEVAALLRTIAPSRLVLGVDRLDYSKGIPERLDAFGRLLELHPEWRGQVSLVQISVPSRQDVPEYAEQRRRVENSVGRINGEFGDATCGCRCDTCTAATVARSSPSCTGRPPSGT